MKPRSNLKKETFEENVLTPYNGIGDVPNINILRGWLLGRRKILEGGLS